MAGPAEDLEGLGRAVDAALWRPGHPRSARSREAVVRETLLHDCTSEAVPPPPPLSPLPPASSACASDFCRSPGNSRSFTAQRSVILHVRKQNVRSETSPGPACFSLQLAADSRLATSSRVSFCPCYVQTAAVAQVLWRPRNDTAGPEPNVPWWAAQERRRVVRHPRTGEAWPLQYWHFWLDQGGTQGPSLAATLEERPRWHPATHAATGDRPEPGFAPLPGAYLLDWLPPLHCVQPIEGHSSSAVHFSGTLRSV